MVFLMISSIVADTSATGSLSVLAVTASLLLQAPNSWLCCCQQATAALREKGKSGKSSTKERDKSVSTSQSQSFPVSRHFPEIERERTNKPRTGNMARVGGWRFALTLEDGILHHSRENGPKKTHSWTKAEGRDWDCRGRDGVSRAGEHSGLPQKGQHGVLACLCCPFQASCPLCVVTGATFPPVPQVG